MVCVGGDYSLRKRRPKREAESPFWYHLSDRWTGKTISVSPQAVRADSENPADLQPCICVCPTIGQCVIALGAWQDYSEVRVYRTRGIPEAAGWVFDYTVTAEHRFYVPRTFEFLVTLDLKAFAIDLDVLAGTLLGIKKALDKDRKVA